MSKINAKTPTHKYQQQYYRLQAELTDTLSLLALHTGNSNADDPPSLCRARQKQQRIQNALLRFQRGNYGACLQCGHAIGEKRLHLLPYAELCLKCQQLKESESL